MDSLEQKLSRVDLNLLISLSTLLKEKSVSRAAERLYLSQSAMSRTLQRLRDLFEDPLFHRTSSGIVPTEKAQNLEALLPDLLQKLESILHSETFTVQLCDKHFSLSLPTLTSHAFFLPLLRNVLQQAPNVQLSEYPAKANPYKSLESGFLDFAIHVEKPLDKAIITTPIGKISLVILARKDHPITMLEKTTLADCLTFRFLDLTVQGDSTANIINPIDSILLKRGFHRDIQLQSSQLSILLDVLTSSDSLFIAPDFLLKSTQYQQELKEVYQFEQTNSNSVELFLLQHQRTENSAAHQWLRDKILQQSF